MVVYATCSSSDKLSRISRTEQVPSFQNCSRIRVSAFENRVLLISPTDHGNATTTYVFLASGNAPGFAGAREIRLLGKKKDTFDVVPFPRAWLFVWVSRGLTSRPTS